jgi:thiamine biosynthesis lipoprotein
MSPWNAMTAATSGWVVAILVGWASQAAAALPVLAGPAMGTTYRITLAAEVPGLTQGEVHREIERVLARIDRAANTWRADSDASRFNQAAPGIWVEVDAELVAIVALAREVHDASGGGFDITVSPLVTAWRRSPPPDAAELAGLLERVGMRHVDSRPTPPALRKAVAGVEIELGGIGPGWAVDRIGERLAVLGSAGHLVELGGEVRAWGRRPDGSDWRVLLREEDGARPPAAADESMPPPSGPNPSAPPPSSRIVALAPGEALGTSGVRPGRSPIDPRTGRPAGGSPTAVFPGGGSPAATVRGPSCAAADAWAVAAVVLGLSPGPDGTIPLPAALVKPAGSGLGTPADHHPAGITSSP